MEAKNEALELAQTLQALGFGGTCDISAAMLRTQAAEIEQVKAELQRVYAVVESHAQITFKAEDERDKLKAKNEKLVSAVETVCEGFTLHPSARKILETGLYGESPKENT